MRVALVHSRYADEDLSGENVTVDQQARILEQAGHDVLVEIRRTRQARERPLYEVAAAWRVATGRGGSASDRLRAFAPDVVHVHNLFPNFGTAWLATWPGAVVATLHNFRYLCANALLLREGQPCFECPTGSSWSAVRHACYRGSRAATIPLALSTRRGLAASPVVARADRLVALADHAREVFTRFGAPMDRIDVVPNGIEPRRHDVSPAPVRPRYLAVGRFSAEKGIEPLLRDWPQDLDLDLVGDGPLAPSIRAVAGPSVRLLGALDARWRDEAAAYTAVIAPGLALEAAVPRVVIEAWEAGVPVVAREAGGAGLAVAASGAGLTYRDASSLRAALIDAHDRAASLRAAARAAYEATYTPQAWLAAMEATYAAALDHRRA